MKKFLFALLFPVLPLAVSVSTPAFAEAKETAVTVGADGFAPANFSVKKGEKARLVFTRNTDKTCATRVVIPDLGIDRELPLNKPVVVEIEPKKGGEAVFSCPLKMLKGKIKITD